MNNAPKFFRRGSTLKNEQKKKPKAKSGHGGKRGVGVRKGALKHAGGEAPPTTATAAASARSSASTARRQSEDRSEKADGEPRFYVVAIDMSSKVSLVSIGGAAARREGRIRGGGAGSAASVSAAAVAAEAPADENNKWNFNFLGVIDGTVDKTALNGVSASVSAHASCLA